LIPNYYYYFKWKEYNACESSPCKNGARCNVSNGGNSFTCACINGYTGQFCQNRNFLFYFILFYFIFKLLFQSNYYKNENENQSIKFYNQK